MQLDYARFLSWGAVVLEIAETASVCDPHPEHPQMLFSTGIIDVILNVNTLSFTAHMKDALD